MRMCELVRGVPPQRIAQICKRDSGGISHLGIHHPVQLFACGREDWRKARDRSPVYSATRDAAGMGSSASTRSPNTVRAPWHASTITSYCRPPCAGVWTAV